MSLMGTMMDWEVERMSKEEKLRLVADIMPKIMEDMYPEDMMDLMSTMMPMMMDKMGEMDPTVMMDAIHSMIPNMMEGCLDKMGIEDREKMFTFCTRMLMDLKERFHG